MKRQSILVLAVVSAWLIVIILPAQTWAVGSYGWFVWELNKVGSGQWAPGNQLVSNTWNPTVEIEPDPNTAYYLLYGTTWLGCEGGLITETISGSFNDSNLFVSGVLQDPNDLVYWNEIVNQPSWAVSAFGDLVNPGLVDPNETRLYYFENFGAFAHGGVPIFVRPEAGQSYTDDFSIMFHTRSVSGCAVYNTITFDVILPSLGVQNPNGGETLIAGETYDINWSSTGSISDVLIEYSINNGTDWNDVNTVLNTGTYEWLVPMVNSDQCLVRISDATNPDVNDTSDGVFTIEVVTIYVDDDAPGDPCHGNPDYSDPFEDGSPEHPFDAIQEGIDAAIDGDTVMVLEGTFTGAGKRGNWG